MAENYFNFLFAQQYEYYLRKIARRNIRDAHNPFELPETEFQRIFRFTKPMVLYVCDELQVDLAPLNSEGLPVYIKVLTCMHHLGDGGYQRPTGQDHTLCIGQSTVSKYLTQFTDAVIRVLMPKWVYFPGSENERRSVANGFQSKFGLPDILGAIDCTHIAIFPPEKPEGIQFKNRKGVYSINTQLICDVDCRIISCNARYPGRVHDSFIFNNSIIKNELRRLHMLRIGEYYLLGDSGYALEPWLMTPVLDAAPDSPSDRFTQWHCRVRNTIERTNGYLKGTFRILGYDRVLHYSPEKASKIIYACATLYNIMLHYRIPFEEAVEDEARDSPGPMREETSGFLLHAAQNKRNNIINRYFSYI